MIAASAASAARRRRKMAPRKKEFLRFSNANGVSSKIVAPMVTLARSASGNTEEQFYE
jgi:hypothetical protein